MGLMTNIRIKHILLMQKTLDALGNVLKYVTPQQASTMTDETNGWTILEVLCHLRDTDEIYLRECERILERNYPILTSYDYNALALERQYTSQNLTQVYVDLVKSRRLLIEFFEALKDDHWNRAGLHPDHGHFTLTDALVYIAHHDIEHLEQITRILAETYYINSTA